MMKVKPSILAEPWVPFRRQAFTDRCTQAIHIQKEILPQSQSWVSPTLVHFGAPFPETSSTKTADSTLPLNFFKLLVQWLRTTLRTTYLHPRTEILRWEYYNPQFREGAMEIQSESVHKSCQEIGRGVIPTTIQASCLQVPGFLHCTMLLFKSMKISIFLRLHSWRDKSLLPYLR